MKPIFAIFLIILVGMSLTSGEESEVASKFGYTNKSEKVSAGPYTLHYGESKGEYFYLLAKGNHNIISFFDGSETSVYQRGLPWLSYQTDAGGIVTNISMTIADAQGKMMILMIDENADGQWDMKFDIIQKKAFIWRDGKWVPREKKNIANHASEAIGAPSAPQPQR